MYFLTLITFIVFLAFVFIFCEYLIYYIVLYQCSWPQLAKTTNDGLKQAEEELKVVLLADTHLLGIRKGHWFDKLRREWQMYRSFQTLLALHEPEVVFILGDIFDEASFSPDAVYETYVARFFELFRVDKKCELFVVAGNHDIGFHYAMHPHLVNRFSETLNAPSVRIITKKNNHFVLVNSMALERDGCHICRQAERQIQHITNKFRCSNNTGKCSHGMKLAKYSRPILLMHFPLFRENDAHCTESTAAPHHLKYVKFKEKWDCLSKEATHYLLDKLHPRTVFTGHTHHGCQTLHKTDIQEHTIPSFSWRNKPNPSFVMAVFNTEQYAVHWCHMPHEYLVIAIYIISLPVGFVLLCRSSVRSKPAVHVKKEL